MDEIRLSIIPILLGDGLRLFGDASPEQRWRLKDVVAYNTGVVELLYGSRINQLQTLKAASRVVQDGCVRAATWVDVDKAMADDYLSIAYPSSHGPVGNAIASP